MDRFRWLTVGACVASAQVHRRKSVACPVSARWPTRRVRFVLSRRDDAPDVGVIRPRLPAGPKPSAQPGLETASTTYRPRLTSACRAVSSASSPAFAVCGVQHPVLRRGLELAHSITTRLSRVTFWLTRTVSTTPRCATQYGIGTAWAEARYRWRVRLPQVPNAPPGTLCNTPQSASGGCCRRQRRRVQPVHPGVQPGQAQQRVDERRGHAAPLRDLAHHRDQCIELDGAAGVHICSIEVLKAPSLRVIWWRSSGVWSIVQPMRAPTAAASAIAAVQKPRASGSSST